MARPYFSEILDHLGLVAGMFDGLGIDDVLDQATQQTPATRFVTVGNAVKAVVLNGLGCVTQQLYLVPRFFQNKPTQRLAAPGIDAEHLNDEALGRALDTLYAYGVTELTVLSLRPPLSGWAWRPALPISIAPVSMSMGAITARTTLTSTASISPAATAVIIGLISTK